MYIRHDTHEHAQGAKKDFLVICMVYMPLAMASPPLCPIVTKFIDLLTTYRSTDMVL